MEIWRIAFGTAPNLPDEIIVYILLWLPVRSLLKFKCVSKSWCCLISSPSFIESHVKIYGKNGNKRIIFKDLFRSTTIHHCSLNSLLPGSVVTSADFGLPEKINGTMEVVGCLDGLICILVTCAYFCLWNPSTRKFKVLPEMTTEFRKNNVSVSGFGFDEFSKDYKVVATGIYSEMFTKVYSLKSNSWKSVEVYPGCIPFNTKSIGLIGKFADGKLHWVRTLPSWDRIEIVSFDLTKCLWEKMHLPNYCLEGFFSCVGVRGAYQSVEYANLNLGIGIDVYKRSGSGRNDISVSCVGTNDIILFLQMKSSRYIVKGNFSKSGGRMIKSDPRKQAYISRRNIRQAWIYHESLVPLFY